MRIGGLNCGIESKVEYRPFLLLLVMGSVLFVHVITTGAFAKTPGQKHCYRKVCHKVKSLAETKALVGRTIAIVASHYDSPLKDRFNTGVFTSSGTKFNADDATAAASSDFPDGTELLVWNPKNGRAAHVRVTDFGPFHTNRKLDLTRAAAETLRFAHEGVIKLRVTIVAPPPPDEPRYKLNRTYRKVGGFVGVYRKEELASLASLLISQAERRRQPAKPTLVAVRNLAVAEQNTISNSTLNTDQNTATVTAVAFQSPSLSQDGVVLSQTLPGGTKLSLPASANPSSTTSGLRTLASLESGTSIDIGAKIAALALSKPRTINRISDVPVDTSESWREKNFKSEIASIDGSSPGASSLFVASNRIGKSTFLMGYGSQGITFLIVALVLTSSAFFAAYFSVSRSVVGVSQNNPLPKRRFFERQNDLADVKFVTPTDDDLDETDPEQDSSQKHKVRRTRANKPSEVTYIKKGSIIAGNMTMDGGVIVEGSIEGDCICDTLTLGSSGTVLGRVKAQKAVIDGRVDGRVDVGDLHVKDEGHIKGEVRYCELAMDHGAVLEARCKRVSSI